MINNRKVFIIAEAGVNHNGSMEIAKEMIDVARNVGADAIKFQSFKAENLLVKSAPKAAYQKKVTNPRESQFEMIKKLELSFENHRELFDYSRKKGILFLSTPFDLESLDLLTSRFKLPIIKIPSGEITNPLLLLKVAQLKRKVILSTGMSNLGEIEDALSVLAFGFLKLPDNPSTENCRRALQSSVGKKALREKVTLLHCTTEYPASYKDVNLRVMETLKLAFELEVGLSDHSNGIAIPIAAVALGAKVIEKHFTLDRSLPGPDHKASLIPGELEMMVSGIRAVEDGFGSSQKIPAPCEEKNMVIARKSLVALRKIRTGEQFTKENLGVKRPGSGISPMQFWHFIGREASKKYFKDQLISE